MRRLLKWLWIPLVLLLIMAAAYAADRLLLAPICPHCHTDITKNLPLFDPSQDGLVRIRANGMEFRARVAGFSNHGGDGVMLLHGFPETSIMWEPMLDRLAKGGFRAVAFDQRGYSPGARPFRLESYRSGKLAADVIAVAAAVGFDRFHVVGHDFGAAIAWIAADRFPRQVIGVTSLSTPHPEALAEALDKLRGQRLRSSYAVLYWIPVLPELVLGFNRAAYLQRLHWQFHPPEHVEEYKQVFSEPGALRGALNWYRAFKFRPDDPLGKIRQPTLFIWGSEDGAFGPVAAEQTADYVEGPFRFLELKAGHQLMLEAPDVVANAVLSHLRNWSQISEQWKFQQGITPSQDASPCDQTTPHCLNVVVSPNGSAVRIRNRCDEPYQGSVRVACTGWSPGTFIEYRFDLGAGGDLIQENNGFSFGDCYYNRFCTKSEERP